MGFKALMKRAALSLDSCGIKSLRDEWKLRLFQALRKLFPSRSDWLLLKLFMRLFTYRTYMCTVVWLRVMKCISSFTVLEFEK